MAYFVAKIAPVSVAKNWYEGVCIIGVHLSVCVSVCACVCVRYLPHGISPLDLF